MGTFVTPKMCIRDSFYTSIGEFDHAEALMKKVDFPKSLVLNASVDGLISALKRNK